ncbi:uncharacterized protein LOC117182908 [Belonocnema kinseyi]|uniref:uncharacterized protein LOC117182908 n=1 Tax=Belonocnema kinseyi TaxID=2817044 RepID=UPI00143D2E19|nr:uncharacterized protein LOC117182908 [Belonocnema kinseyi]
MDLTGLWTNDMEVVELTIRTSLEMIAFLSIYVSPDARITHDFRQGLIDHVSHRGFLIMCGDINAHTPMGGSPSTNYMGNQLCPAVFDSGLIPLNDSAPTYISVPGRLANNLDLVFSTAALATVSTVRVGDNSHNSDHAPVFGRLDTSPALRCSSSCRFSIKLMDWGLFNEKMEGLIPSLRSELVNGAIPANIYDRFISAVCDSLEACGAYRPDSPRGHRSRQPLRWNAECKMIQAERKLAGKRFVANQTDEEMETYRRVDCFGLSSWTALHRDNYGPLFFGHSGIARGTGSLGHSSSAFFLEGVSGALSLCKAKSSPGMDGQWYVLRLFFPGILEDTRVHLIPKLGGRGFRPISLTPTFFKLFKRLTQRRLKFLAEGNDWISDFQFYFRRGRPSMDDVSSVVSDIMKGFGGGKGTLDLALNLKGACNAVLPEPLIDELRGLGVPTRLLNLVSFLVSQQNCFFSSDRSKPRPCGVGAPQGGVLSQLLIWLVLRRQHLPDGVSVAMYADDLLLYVTRILGQEAFELLELACEQLTPWLESLGLSITIPKSQLCLARKLDDLATATCTKGFRVNPEKVNLLAAYGAMGANMGALDYLDRLCGTFERSHLHGASFYKDGLEPFG